jgi:hypothetical protein
VDHVLIELRLAGRGLGFRGLGKGRGPLLRIQRVLRGLHGFGERLADLAGARARALREGGGSSEAQDSDRGSRDSNAQSF